MFFVRKINKAFLLCLGVFSFFLSVSPLRAATGAGLIKGSSPTVFYLADNDRRYAFPNEQTFKTWYRDFMAVRVISDQELDRYVYGGNVTYRPGIRLLKRQNDSKIYTVGQGGMLRWITTESIILALYGQEWSTLVDVLPEARIGDYVFGDPVRSISDVSPSHEKKAVKIVEQNRRFPSIVSLPPSETASRPLDSRFSVPDTAPMLPFRAVPIAFPDIPPVTTSSNPSPLLIPPQYFAVEEADRGVRLRWADASTGERNYRVERRETGTSAFRVITTLPANTVTFVDRTARVGVRYLYRVVTVGAANVTQASQEEVITTRGSLLDHPPTATSFR